MPNFRYCLAPGCTSGQEHIGTPESHPIFKCQACMVRSCLVHEGPWHEGQTCAEYDEHRTRSGRENEGQTYAENSKARTRSERENLASEQAIQLLAKNCPGCSRPIQKSGGCDHMKCMYLIISPEIVEYFLIINLLGTKCKHEFCWVCLVDYKDIRKYDNSHHKFDCSWHSNNMS